MGTHTHRGFVPLVAIILLGLVAVAGGTIATVSMQKTDVPEGQASDTVKEEAALAPVSPRVASSTSSTSMTAPEPVLAKIRANLKPESKELCRKAKAETVPSTPSLIGQIVTLCEQLEQPATDSAEQRDRWNELEESLGEKWELWLKTQRRTN